ncbi:phytoene desaturase family protein [Romboutsia sp. 1001713B170207_170306_H8]|uniref:phytoene desaturase family protein n=1 Tax=Romboutsia sp. 1001713B170207_170306_H8 TaxID=2787112 RepID=UPI0018981F1D|nr:phytoene desaturase family protein [Romboutsia sp. 1001713B170207_170306_H8]
MKKVIIIGAGIGGLCTAIRLLNKGYKVTILEKENRVGGKVNLKEKNGFKFDLTASVLMTPDIYTKIFEEVGKDYKDYFELINLNLIYRVNYNDKSYLDIYSDTRKMINFLEDIQEGLSIEYFNLIMTSFKKYLISKKGFLDEPMIDINETLNLKSLQNLIYINPISSASRYISSKISNKKLREYFIFKSMYIGVNPYTNSNLYTLIPSISSMYGLWYIKGGMYKYISSLERLIKELKGEIKLNKEVSKVIIKNNNVIGVKCDNKIYESDIVICNADYPYTIKDLFEDNFKEFRYNKNNIDNKDYSCSVFIIYLGLNKKYENLKVHNIYINDNFRESIEAAFKGCIPKQPSLYIYSPSSIDESMCPKGCSVMNIIVRVPNLKFKDIKWDRKFIRAFRDKIILEVKNIKGLEDIDKNIVHESYLTPLDLKDKFNAYYGNAFGISHKLSQIGYMRPHIKSKTIKGLYFIGSSTHPGNGVSVIIDGSKIVSEVINNDNKE